MDTQSAADSFEPRGVARARYRIHIAKTFDAFEAVRREWEELEAASEEHSFCLSFQYCELAAARALANGELVVVVMVYGGRDLCAIWPLSIQRKGMLRIANAMTCGNHEEYGGPLIKGQATVSMVAECVRAVMKIPADALEIQSVQDGSLLQEALEAAPQSWVLQLLPKRLTVLPGYSVGLRAFDEWEDYCDTLSHSLRRNLRRYRRGLSAIGRTEFGWCTTLDDAVTVLTWLFSNKRRWAESRGLNTRYLMENQVRDFFIELARETDLSAVPLVAFVRVDGMPVAASINLVGPRTLEYWIFTYDAAYSRYSVGNLLTEFIAKWAHANCRDFDMRPFYNEYKTYWVNRETRHRTRYVFLSARGRAMEFRLLHFQISRVWRRLGKAIASALRSMWARLPRQLFPPPGN
jgi:CelD/BcsL family acetyltransferase involved in cellulose biosynthesis